MSSLSVKPIKVFISYSHRDADWLARIVVHLKPLTRKYEIEIWDDTKINPGTRWKEEIAEAVKAAKVAILLVSADFLSSDFIVNNELPPLLSAAESEGTLILLIILSPSLFSRTESLNQFQAVNDPSRPLISLTKGEQEQVFVKVAEQVETFLGSIAVSDNLQNKRELMDPIREDMDSRIEDWIAMIPDIRPKSR